MAETNENAVTRTDEDSFLLNETIGSLEFRTLLIICFVEGAQKRPHPNFEGVVILGGFVQNMVKINNDNRDRKLLFAKKVTFGQCERFF